MSDASGVVYRVVRGLDAAGFAPYETLTYPSLQRYGEATRSHAELLAVSAEIGRERVGLVVAVPPTASGQANVLSLFVRPDHRRAGIATGLLTQLEATLREQACREITLTYLQTDVTSVAMEPLLARAGWQAPTHTMRFGRGAVATVVKAPWVAQRDPLPAGYEVVPWRDLPGAAVDDVKRRQQEKPWYPEGLSPFADEHLFEPINSIALCHGGKVWGWMATHRVADDTIRYTNWFVARRHQRQTHGAMLMAEAYRLQAATDVPYFTFAVNALNAPVIAFVQRRLDGHVLHTTDVFQASKHFSSPEVPAEEGAGG